MVKERQYITGSDCLKGVLGRVIVDEKGIKDSWKEYMKKAAILKTVMCYISETM